MDQGLLPRRYAKAIYEFALDRGQTAQLYKAMGNIADAFEALPTLQATIANPFVDDKDKEKLLAEASKATGDTATAMADVLRLLATNKRMDIARDIALAYQRLYRIENHIHAVSVVSAAPLGEADRERLGKLIKEHLGDDTAEITYGVNHDLIGGFTVTIDSEQLDASVRNELEQLRLKLLG